MNMNAIHPAVDFLIWSAAGLIVLAAFMGLITFFASLLPSEGDNNPYLPKRRRGWRL